MQLVTTETIPGEEIVEAIGIARGNTVEARNVGRDITQGLRNIVGGELKAYLNQGGSPALQRGRESDTTFHKPRSTLTPGYPP